MAVLAEIMYNITDEDVKYCEWLTRRMYRERYSRLPDEDEMQEAMLGMCEAALDYDEDKGRQFPGWAKFQIFRHMLMHKPGRFRANGVPVKPEMYLLREPREYNPARHYSANEEEKIVDQITADELLDMFSPKLRGAMIRHFFNEETYTDMADELGYGNNRSLSTVIGQRIKEIREELGGEDG